MQASSIGWLPTALHSMLMRPYPLPSVRGKTPSCPMKPLLTRLLLLLLMLLGVFSEQHSKQQQQPEWLLHAQPWGSKFPALASDGASGDQAQSRTALDGRIFGPELAWREPCLEAQEPEASPAAGRLAFLGGPLVIA